MGAVCAVVYLLSLIVFIPFAFYKDIVAATSGGGNRDVVIEDQHIETGRFLHRFPHGRVSLYPKKIFSTNEETESRGSACLVPLGSLVLTIYHNPWHWGRSSRHSLEAQGLDSCICSYPHAGCLLCRLWRDTCCRTSSLATIPWRLYRPRVAVLHVHGGRRNLLS